MGSFLHQEVEEIAAHQFCLDGLSSGTGWVPREATLVLTLECRMFIKEHMGSTLGKGGERSRCGQRGWLSSDGETVALDSPRSDHSELEGPIRVTLMVCAIVVLKLES